MIYTTQQQVVTNGSTNTLSQEINDPHVNPDGILGKDDFMKLLLLELQNQDPTDPMDSDKILSQTSQLAQLESADNTNKALEKLSKSLASSQQFSVISAIGKMASLDSDGIQHTEGESVTFDIYFPTDVSKGTLSITDMDGNVVKTLELKENAKGTYSFDWNGNDDNGNQMPDGIYKVSADYLDQDGEPQHTAVGTYPIESVRFEDGEALVKLGSRYVPMSEIKEIY